VPAVVAPLAACALLSRPSPRPLRHAVSPRRSSRAAGVLPRPQPSPVRPRWRGRSGPCCGVAGSPSQACCACAAVEPLRFLLRGRGGRPLCSDRWCQLPPPGRRGALARVRRGPSLWLCRSARPACCGLLGFALLRLVSSAFPGGGAGRPRAPCPACLPLFPCCRLSLLPPPPCACRLRPRGRAAPRSAMTAGRRRRGAAFAASSRSPPPGPPWPGPRWLPCRRCVASARPPSLSPLVPSARPRSSSRVALVFGRASRSPPPGRPPALRAGSRAIRTLCARLALLRWRRPPALPVPLAPSCTPARRACPRAPRVRPGSRRWLRLTAPPGPLSPPLARRPPAWPGCRPALGPQLTSAGRWSRSGAVSLYRVHGQAWHRSPRASPADFALNGAGDNESRPYARLERSAPPAASSGQGLPSLRRIPNGT